MSREFNRRIQLPTDVDPSKLTSTLSADGILSVEAPVPPRYHAIVAPSNHSTAPRASPALDPRASPLTVRFNPAAGRPRSPLHDAPGGRRSPLAVDSGGRSSPLVDHGGRRSPFAVGTVDPTGRRSPFAVGGHVPVPPRGSPVPFGALAPVATLPVAGIPGGHQGIDRPVVTTDPATGRRRLELVLELGRPYTAEDVVVRVDGRRLNVEVQFTSRAV